jgi:hypothetical protein
VGISACPYSAVRSTGFAIDKPSAITQALMGVRYRTRDRKFEHSGERRSPTIPSRVQEVAIRMALGSQRAGIVRLVLESGAKLALIGCVVGLAGAVAASGLLRSLLFGVSPFDPLVLALAAVGVLLLAVAASALPAFNAASIDPVQALRGE